VSAPEVSVVLPVYRTRDALPELHRRLSNVLERDHDSWELVFVDDGSPDGAFQDLERIAEEDPHVSVVRLPRNGGQHRAVLAGLAAARGRVFVVMDADLQDPPEAIPMLLEGLGRGYAAVFAGRRGRYESAGRLLTSRALKRTLHLLTGVPPDAGLFVVMDARMRARLLEFRVRRPFLVAMMGATGLRLESIPVQRAPRPHGRSAYSSLERIRAGAAAAWWALGWRLGLGGGARR
jgi:glycosyltransferase involved in cell wall biosynthesis